MAAQTLSGTPDVQEMVVVHRVFRREYGLAPAMVRAVPAGDTARAAAVSSHLTEMGSMLHHHHTAEDELVWPRLDERVRVAGDLVARMEEQHSRVSSLLHRVDTLLPVWGSSADAALREELARVLDDVAVALDEHLTEEEAEILPLVERHLTVAEWRELGERGRGAMPKARMLVILGHILEDASPEERRKFLGHAPPPVRLLYRVVGRRTYEREVAVLRAGLSIPRQRKG